MTWNSFLKSKLATWVLGLSLLFVMVMAARVMIQKYQIDAQIAKLETEASKFKKGNDQLSFLNQYLNTQDYKQQAAREKLNLKKNGEIVVGLPNNDNASVSGAQTSAVLESNPKRWFNYFFIKP